MRSARRLLRRKEREAAGEFLAEGRQAVAGALAQPGTVIDLLVGADVVERHQDLLHVAVRADVRVGSVPPAQLATLADTVTPQGVLAVCRTVDVSLDEALAGEPRLVVLCDQVRDPGNLGTVVRCADAFGADAVLVSRGSVDLYNAKTVRASTGSLFHLPVVVDVDLAEAVSRARTAGLQVFGADGGGHGTVDDAIASGELARPVLWVLGNEAWGLPSEHVALVDRLVALPMYGRAESLNLSTAAAVFLYATATAQRAPS
ncbi:TrmH family RNA methyltransferase [uncultured Friedmanniella sp.]|uniref:TrmH family RNA methyltransferase n=1 Tax=uncultured Friedmanniella sp. TaxID=335381 RepID=UPI0035CCA0B2